MRSESDRYGTVSIEDNRLYGVQTVRALENLSCSRFKMSDYPTFIRALSLVKNAAAQANKQAAVISPELCRLISAACELLCSGAYDQDFPVDMLHGGGSIAFNQNMNEVVAGLAGQLSRQEGGSLQIRAREDVNASQSTADSCSTAFRLAVLAESEALLQILGELEKSLEKHETASQTIFTVARTCLQDAMPTPFSSVFSGWRSVLERQKQELASGRARLCKINLGATVIGTSAGACVAYRERVVEQLAEISGYPLKLNENLFDAAQNIDELVDFAKRLGTLAAVLIKLCGDLRLLSSGPKNGFGELILPAVQDGSSFFSEKNNPVVPETAMQACFHVMGNQRAAEAALEHGELNLNVFESGAFFHVLDSLQVLSAALKLLDSKCIKQLRINEPRCAAMLKAHLETGNIKPTELSDVINCKGKAI